MRPLLGVVADDLTGGLDTAAMLVALGVECGFATGPQAMRPLVGKPAVVIAQKTRVGCAREAVNRAETAAKALLDAGARQLFFKYCATFDSTDEGNIGPVADRLLELTCADHTAFCPTSIEAGRTVYNGHLFVGTQLVSESPKRFDPLTPMADPDLVRVLQRQSRLPVGLLQYEAVSRGGADLREQCNELVRLGIRHIIVDAICKDNLDAIAALTVDWKLMTGNAAIVQHYPTLWRERGWLTDETAPKCALPAIRGPAVVLAGSCAERTLEQIAAFARYRPVNHIDLATIDSPQASIARTLDWARSRLDCGPIAVTTSAPLDRVRASQVRYGREGAARLAEEILGGIAVGLHALGVRRFVIAGGETSGTVLQRLGIERLRVGAYMEPGVSRATTEDDDPLALSLKSGKLGPIDMFLQTLESMTTHE